MLRTISLLCVLCFYIIGGAEPAKARITGDQIWTSVKKMQQVGHATYYFGLWEVYEAALSTPNGTWSNNAPFALSLTYARSIKGKKIAGESVKQMRVQGIVNEIVLATWHGQMRNIFPDVKKGTTLTGVFTKDKKTHFFHDGKAIGVIDDPAFGISFFNIWLGKNTSYPLLRRQLLKVKK